MRPNAQSLKRSAVALAALSLPLVLLPAQALGADPPAGAAPAAPAPPGPDGAAPATAPPAELKTFYEQQVSWTECGDGSINTKCAIIDLPLDYADPTGKTITVSLKKVLASDGTAEHGALFTNPGGPGSSGIDYVDTAARALSEDVRAGYDIIGFDPRGVGKSTPLTCWAPEEVNGLQDQQGQDAAGRPADEVGIGAPAHDLPDLASLEPEVDDEPPAVPDGPAGPGQQTVVDAAARQAKGAEMAAACAQHSAVPEILDHMDTSTVVRDIDVMRVLMGDTKLNYIGTSYGTYIGARYLEAFPGNAGRIVLDSSMDPAMPRSQIHADTIAYYESALRTYAEACLGGSAGQGCPLTGTADEAMTQLRTFLEGLDNKPLTLDGTTATLSRTQATSFIKYIASRRQEYWPALTEGLSQAMTSGNGTSLRTSYRKVQTAYASSAISADGGGAVADQRTSALNSSYAFFGVHCADYPDTGDTASWDAQAAELKKSFPISYNSSSAYTDALCHGWGHTASAQQPHRVSAAGSGPVVVIGNRRDPQTVYPWAVSMSEQLEDGDLLTVEDAIHGAVRRNTCAASSVSSFLVTGTPPAQGTVCQADPATPLAD